MVGHADVRGDAVHDREPQRLHAMEPHPVAIETEGDHLIQPRHQRPGMVLAETDDLSRLSESLLHKPRRIQPVVQDARVLPERLIDHIVGICVDRRHGDVPLGFRAAQQVRAQENYVTREHRLRSELAEQDRTAIADDDNLHAVIGERPDGPVQGLS
ncbi:hypothetical protein, partial [uncultured Aeromicrobium sp.]|uniref:hypothetical protein n=1 Tax=uncultured Aeromicrobium sp. TaxID=337820 RepID=UPI0025EDC280